MSDAIERRRLVSFLGTTRSSKTKYRNATDGRECETPFIIEALDQFYSPDEWVILATDKAWEVNGPDGTNVDNLGNASELDRTRLQESRKAVPDGASFWDQFALYLEALKAPEDTEVLLDITHGWRAFPFFAGAAITYLRTAHGQTGPIRVFYGAFEPQKPSTPIWDVSPVIELIDWGRGLDQLMNAGRSPTDLLDSLESAGNVLRKQYIDAQDTHQGAPNLGGLARAMRTFAEDFETQRMISLLTRSAPALVNSINEQAGAVGNHIPPLAPVLDRLKQRAAGISSRDIHGDSGRNAAVALARAYEQTGRTLQAAASVREGTVNLSATELGVTKLAHRSVVERRLHDVGNEWLTLATIRNDLLHGGMREAPAKPPKLKAGVRSAIDRLEQASPLPQPLNAPARRGFLNLSNHPCSGWSDDQRRAAQALSTPVVDRPFPAVSVQASSSDVEGVADQIVGALEPLPEVAMVQGEFTLTMALVSRLQARGVRCVAAVSERMTEIAQDGSKVSVFEFAGFREYPAVGR